MTSPDEMLEYFLEEAKANTDDLVIGENISPIPELKIIFDGYQEDEDTGEDIYSSESYAFFIHKDALKKGFIFPNLKSTPNSASACWNLYGLAESKEASLEGEKSFYDWDLCCGTTSPTHTCSFGFPFVKGAC